MDRPYAPIPEATGVVHDLTAVDYAFTARDRGAYGHITSWSAYRTKDKPQPGDQVILRNPDGRTSKTSRYRVIDMNPCWNVDPPTMWMANLVFDPRSGPVE